MIGLRRTVKDVGETELGVGPEDDLFEDPDANLVADGGATQMMDVLMGGVLRRDIGKVPILAANLLLSMPHSVTPFGMHVTEGAHIETGERFEFEHDRHTIGADEIN